MVRTIASVVDRGVARTSSIAFLLAASAAALVTGAVTGFLGAISGAATLPMELQVSVIFALLLLGVADDARVLRLRWPYLRRQVGPGRWRHGPAAAALGWGFELGTGFLTHVRSKTLYPLLAACFFSGTISAALLYGLYGATKGMQPLIAVTGSACASESPQRAAVSVLRRIAVTGSLVVCTAAFVGVWSIS